MSSQPNAPLEPVELSAEESPSIPPPSPNTFNGVGLPPPPPRRQPKQQVQVEALDENDDGKPRRKGWLLGAGVAGLALLLGVCLVLVVALWGKKKDAITASAPRTGATVTQTDFGNATNEAASATASAEAKASTQAVIDDQLPFDADQIGVDGTGKIYIQLQPGYAKTMTHDKGKVTFHLSAVVSQFIDLDDPDEQDIP